MADDDDDLLVSISGPALSLLLYENVRSHDQIGFLLGEILVYVTKKVTDSDRDVERVKKHINIKTVVAYPLGEPFFNTTGVIDQEKLKNFLKYNAKNVVGWYHYRQEYRFQATSMRDRIMHADLSDYFSNINSLLPKDIFIFCFLTSQVSDIGGTHKFKHILYRQEGTGFVPVPLKINNLGADVTKPDGTDYIPTPQFTSSQHDAFDKVYENIKNKLETTSGVAAVTLIQKAAENFLDKLIPDVTKSDQRVSELEQQLKELRNQKFGREIERTLLEYQMKQMDVEDCKSDVITEPLSPSSDIFDSPKAQGTSSGTLPKLTKQQSRQESSGDRKRDSTSSERELKLIGGNSPKSSYSDVSRSSPKSSYSEISRSSPKTSYSEVSRSSPKGSGIGSSSCTTLDRGKTSGRTSIGPISGRSTPGTANRTFSSKLRQSPDHDNSNS